MVADLARLLLPTLFTGCVNSSSRLVIQAREPSVRRFQAIEDPLSRESPISLLTSSRRLRQSLNSDWPV